MPTYDYSCTACGHRFEAVQKITEAPLTACPSCQQPTLKKLISAAGIILKGGSWNKSGYKNDSPPPPSCGTGCCPSCID